MGVSLDFVAFCNMLSSLFFGSAYLEKIENQYHENALPYKYLLFCSKLNSMLITHEKQCIMEKMHFSQGFCDCVCITAQCNEEHILLNRIHVIFIFKGETSVQSFQSETRAEYFLIQGIVDLYLLYQPLCQDVSKVHNKGMITIFTKCWQYLCC